MNSTELMLLMSQLSQKKTNETADPVQNTGGQSPLQAMLMAQLAKAAGTGGMAASGNPLQAMLAAQLAASNGGAGEATAPNPLQAMLMAQLAKASGGSGAPAPTPRAAKPAASDNPLHALLAAQAQAGSAPAQGAAPDLPDLEAMLGKLRAHPDGLRLLRQRLQSMIAFVDAQLAAGGHGLTEQELPRDLEAEEARLASGHGGSRGRQGGGSRS